MLERPAAVVAPSAPHDVDGLREPPVARGSDLLEVVESAEDVVVPSRRETETKEHRLDDFTCAVGAEEPMLQEELAAPALSGPHRTDSTAAIELVEPQAFEGADGGVHRRMGRADCIPPPHT